MRVILLVLLLSVVATVPPRAHAAAAPPWPRVGKPYALTHDGSSVLADVSPNGRLILYRSDMSGRDPGSLWIVDRSGSNRRELVRHNVGLAYFLPDGRSILYSASGSLFHRITLQGRLLPGRLDLRGLSWLASTGQLSISQPGWLPNWRLPFAQGRRLVSVDPVSGKRSSMGRLLLPPGNAWENGDLLSPDGRTIAVTYVTDGLLEIEDVRTGRVVRRLSLTDRNSWSPSAWWPDSRSLLLYNEGSWQEALLDVATGRLSPLPGLAGGIIEAAWSPDGNTMASSPNIPGTCMAGSEFLSFFRKDAGHGPSRDGIPSAVGPIWAHDGKAIVYTREERQPRPCALPHDDVWVAPLR